MWGISKRALLGTAIAAILIDAPAIAEPNMKELASAAALELQAQDEAKVYHVETISQPREIGPHDTQDGGGPVLPPKPPAPVLTPVPGSGAAHIAAQMAQATPTPEDEVITEGMQPKNVVPIVVPKDSARSAPINPPRDTVPAFEIGLPLIVDERYFGDMSVRVQGTRVFVPWERFRELTESELTPATLAGFKASEIDGYLEIGTFAVEGADLSYNSLSQQIELTISLANKNTRVLTFGSEQNDRKRVLSEPAKISLFATPIVSMQYVWDDEDPAFDDNFTPFGTLDIGGRFGGERGVAFISRQSFDGRDGGTFARDETVFYYDMFPRLMRISAGDLRPRGDNLQTTPAMLGISVERFFDLEPNRIFRPTSQTTFELERPSTIDIRINGISQQEIFLQPGRYDIRDLPLTQGSNLIDIVIRDDLGRERIISDRNFFDFDLLETGIWDYSFALGTRASFGNDGIEYEEMPIFTGFVRRGISKSLTLGADLQGDEDGINAGATALYAAPLGVFRFGISASERDQFGSGLAADMGYSATGYWGEDGRTRWSTTLGLRYNSEEYSTLPATIFAGASSGGGTVSGPLNGVSPGLSQSKANFNGGIQVAREKWSASLNTNYTQFYGNSRDTYNIIGGVNYRLRPNVNVGIFARQFRTNLIEDSGLTFQISWRPRRDHDLRARYDTLRNESELSYRRSAPPFVGNYAYGVGLISNYDTDTHSLFGDANYIGNRFEAFARHDAVTLPGDDGSFSQISRFSARASLAFADGQFAIGRPVQEAFSIVKSHNSLDGRVVEISPAEDGYIAASGRLGPALVHNLGPYSERSVFYDVRDLPIGYDLGEGQFNVKPPFNSGYKITVGSAASFTLVASVIDSATGEPIPYIGGKLESLDDIEKEPVLAFTNRNGRLAAAGLAEGTYKLTLYTDPEHTQTVVIKDGKSQLIDIGEIRINSASGGTQP